MGADSKRNELCTVLQLHVFESIVDRKLYVCGMPSGFPQGTPDLCISKTRLKGIIDNYLGVG